MTEQDIQTLNNFVKEKVKCFPENFRVQLSINQACAVFDENTSRIVGHTLNEAIEHLIFTAHEYGRKRTKQELKHFMGL